MATVSALDRRGKTASGQNGMARSGAGGRTGVELFEAAIHAPVIDADAAEAFFSGLRLR